MKNKKLLLRGSVITTALFFGWVLFLYLNSFNLAIDLQVQHFMNINQSNFGMIFFKIITASVNILPSAIGVLVFVSFLWFRKQFHTIIIFLSALFLAQILVTGLKHLFIRPRPLFENYNFLLDQFSYPSGHATLGLVWYGFMTYWFASKELVNKKARWIVIIFGTIFVILIGLSRLYLGVHWFSDVVGGFLLGLIILQLLIWRVEQKHLAH